MLSDSGTGYGRGGSYIHKSSRNKFDAQKHKTEYLVIQQGYKFF